MLLQKFSEKRRKKSGSGFKQVSVILEKDKGIPSMERSRKEVNEKGKGQLMANVGGYRPCVIE